MRLWAVWIALALGLWALFQYIPKPGYETRRPAAPLPAALPPPLEGAEESYGRGILALEAERTKEALERFDAAIRADPGMAMAYVQKAFLLAAQEDARPEEIRALLAEADRRGFDRAKALKNLEARIAQGGPAAGRWSRCREVLLKSPPGEGR